MSRVIFDYDNYSSNDIKYSFYLEELLPRDSVQLENIILTIKSIYLHYGIISNGSLNSEMKRMVGKTLMIECYSVIDALVGGLGYKLQMSCRYCHKRNSCSKYSQSIFSGDYDSNERNLFKNSNDYLKKVGILLLSEDSEKLYNLLRDIRNDVHLTRNSEVITKERTYGLDYCMMAIEFLVNFAYMLSNNFNDFKRSNGCNISE